MYEAIITRVRTQPIDGCDNIQAGTAAGHLVIVGKDVQDNTLGILFPEGGQLSARMARENNLFRHPELNADPTTRGYLEDNRRIRTVRMRGLNSEALWMPLTSLHWAGSTAALREGETLSRLNGEAICGKYETRATQQAQQARTKQGGSSERYAPLFKRHYQTAQVRYSLPVLRGQFAFITEKLHGTSGRTGRLPVSVDLLWWKRIANAIASRVGANELFASKELRYVTGSRNLVFEDVARSPDAYRALAHDYIRERGLLPGETVYYEIVGFDRMTPIMGHYTPPDDPIGKAIARKYGASFSFDYGQKPHTCGIYIYRITLTTPEGVVFEYPMERVLSRSNALGIPHVPVIDARILPADDAELVGYLSEAANAPSKLSDAHPSEGVCVRTDTKAYKYKSFDFCHLEGIRKNDESYVDTEEIA